MADQDKLYEGLAVWREQSEKLTEWSAKNTATRLVKDFEEAISISSRIENLMSKGANFATATQKIYNDSIDMVVWCILATNWGRGEELLGWFKTNRNNA